MKIKGWICDACCAEFVEAKLMEAHGAIFGPNQVRWEELHCSSCGLLRDCVRRTDIPSKARAPEKTVSIDEVRRAVADYMRSEGCSCCEDGDEHRKDKKRLAELLNVPPYDDNSGYDFGKFRSPE